MKDIITKDHFISTNFSIETLNPKNLLALNVISARLANRIIEDGFSDIREYFLLSNSQLLRKQHFGRKSLKELRQFQKENFKLNLKGLSPAIVASYEHLRDYVHSKSIDDQFAEIKDFFNKGESLNHLKEKLKKFKYQVRKIERVILQYEINTKDKDFGKWELNGKAAQKIIELIEKVIEERILDTRNCEIFKLRLGIAESMHGSTLQEIGDLFSVSKERIRQIIAKGLRIIRYILTKNQSENVLYLRSITTQIFLNKTIEPKKLIYQFCRKFFGENINILIMYEIICRLIGLRIEEDFSKEISEFKKEELVKERLEYRKFRKRNQISNLLKRLLNSVVCPENMKSFTESEFKQMSLNSRKRNLNDNLPGYGSFFSKKMNKYIFFESGEEYSFYQLLEESDDVLFYYEQAVEIPYYLRGKSVKKFYYPDVIILTKSGKCFVVEVKGTFDLILARTLFKANHAVSYLLKKGIGFTITDSRIQTLKSLAFRKDKISSIENSILKAIDQAGQLYYWEYKNLVNQKIFNTSDFMGFILRNDISFSRSPFSLKRLPHGISFKKYIT